MPAINLHTPLMSFFHTFLWIFLYKIAIHNQLKNYQEIFSSLQESTLHHHSSSIMATAAPTPAPAPTPFLATPRAWTLTTLLQLLLQGEDAIIAWLMAKGLLASSRQCPKCASSCRMVKNKGSPIWRCPRKGCQTRVSIKHQSFFSNTKLSFSSALKIMYMWSRQMRVTAVAEEVKITPKIAVDWYNFCRDVCEEHFLANPIIIGGPGKLWKLMSLNLVSFPFIR